MVGKSYPCLFQLKDLKIKGNRKIEKRVSYCFISLKSTVKSITNNPRGSHDFFAS